MRHELEADQDLPIDEGTTFKTVFVLLIGVSATLLNIYVLRGKTQILRKWVHGLLQVAIVFSLWIFFTT